MKVNKPFIFLLLSALIEWAHQQLGPSIEPYTQPGNVPEDPSIAMEIAKIVLAQGSSQAKTCAVRRSVPPGPFSVQTQGSDFYVYYDASSDLKYRTTNFYALTLVCNDGNIFIGTGPSAYLYVYLQPNIRPRITNYRSDSVSIKVGSFQTSAAVYTILADDVEKDVIMYFLTSQFPNMGLFTLDSGDNTKVKVTRDVKCITEPSFVLTFTISDGKNTIDDFKVDVTMDGINMVPSIKNLPYVIYIKEDAPAGKVFTLDVEDPDNYPSQLTVTCKNAISADDAVFEYSSNTITLKGKLDYETKDTYTINCVANDGCVSTDGTDKLTIYVENVLEGIKFDNTDYSCKLTEDETKRTYCTLPLTVTDVDNFPVATMEFDPYNDNFYFDKTNYRVYMNNPYDVDVQPTTADLVLKVVDTGGSSATANVHITIIDANDNRCTFDKDVSYSLVDQTTAPGKLDNFVVTDKDLTPVNNAANIKVVSTSPRDCNKYVDVTDKGDVNLISTMALSKSGTSCVLTISCKDTGAPQKSSLATVIVSFVDTTTTTTTTVLTTEAEEIEEKDLWEYSWFIAVFSLLMLCLFTGLVALVAFCVYRCCCIRSENEGTPRNKVRPMSSDMESVKRSNSVFDDDDDDFFSSSFRSGSKDQQRNLATPKQIPSLEYK